MLDFGKTVIYTVFNTLDTDCFTKKRKDYGTYDGNQGEEIDA